jgi:hypothetical protein
MKKLFSYISGLFLALAVSLTSCVENDPAANGLDGGEAYISMNLGARSSSAGRALTDEQVNAWENRINEIWMLLYDEDDLLESKSVWKVQNYSNGSPMQLVNFYNANGNIIKAGTESKVAFTSVAQLVKRKDYRMAVLANPNPALFSNIVVGSSLDLLQTAIDGGQQGLSINDFGSYGDDRGASRLFFMSNANGLIKVSKDRLKSDAEDAERDPIEVHLDRLLAKVSVKEVKDGVAILTPDVELDSKRPLKWYVDVVNKKTYPIRKFAYTMGGTVMENENNSQTTNRERIYAEDPNFIRADNSEENFLKWRNGDNPPYGTWMSVDKADPSYRTYQYVFENTMDLDTQRSSGSNFATTIVSRVHLIYKKLLSNLNDENDPGRNYYSCFLVKNNKGIEWRVFTHEQAKLWLESGFPTSTNPDEAEVWRLMEQKLREIQQDYNNGVSGAFNLTAATSPGKDLSTFSTYKQVTYHPLGLNEYRSPIRHFSGGNDPVNRTYGYYGVVRNNEYELTIGSISGPGTGTYEWDNRFISIDIDITPWYRRDFQQEILGEKE